MKQTIICLLVLIFSIPIYCLEFQYQQNVDFGNESNSSLAIYDNYLINKEWGTLDFYEIQNDGSLNLIQRTQSYMHASDIRIYEDFLYIIEYNFCVDNILKIYQITTDGLIETQRKNISTDGYWVEDLEINDNYIFIREHGLSNCLILNRETLEEVGFLNTGSQFYIENSILAKMMINVNENLSAISVFDINDLHNPQEISFTIIGELSYLSYFYKSDNYLFIGRESDITILNVNNWNNPSVETVIPVEEGSHVIDMSFVGNNFVATSKNNALWLYDLHDIHNPILLNHENGLWGYPYNTSNANLVATNENFYIAPNEYALSHFKSSDFPNLIINDSYSNLGITHVHEQTDNCIAYTRGESLRCITINEPLSVLSTELPNNGFTVATNNSIICAYNPSSSTAYIYESDNNSLNQISETNLGNDSFNWLKWLEPFWVNVQCSSSNQIFIMDLIDNQFEIQETITAPETLSHIEQPIDLPYFVFQCYGSSSLYFYDKNPPFNLLGSYSIKVNEVHSLALILDENHMVLGERLDESFPTPKNLYLCTYNSQGFSIVDQTTCSGFDQTLIYRNGYIVTSLGMNDDMQFFQWDNDQLINCGEVEFECQNFNIFLYPDMEKAFVCGRYGVQEYTYAVTSVPSSIVPGVVSLSNYPNPFNPNTEIRFQIFDSSLIQSATIEIYNLRGQKVRKLPLTKDELSSGSIHWNGKNFTNQSVTSGIYLYQLKVDGISLAQQKMTIIK